MALQRLLECLTAVMPCPSVNHSCSTPSPHVMAPFIRILWPGHLTGQLEEGGAAQLLYGFVIAPTSAHESPFVGVAVLGAWPGPCHAKGARQLAHMLQTLPSPSSPCAKWLVRLAVVGAWAPAAHGARSVVPMPDLTFSPWLEFTGASALQTLRGWDTIMRRSKLLPQLLNCQPQPGAANVPQASDRTD